VRPGSHRATDHHRAGSRGWRGCSRSAEGRRRASNRYRVGHASISFPRGVARRRQARRQSLPFERPPTAGYVGRNWVSLNPAGLTPLSSHVRKPMQRSKNGHLWLADLIVARRSRITASLLAAVNELTMARSSRHISRIVSLADLLASSRPSSATGR
jgi:hypothetical protein